MKITEDLYQGSLALLTDFYQLTMANGYWKSGKAEQEAVFNLFFRKHPFQGGFTLAAGLDYMIDFCKNFKFKREDLDYLGAMKTKVGISGLSGKNGIQLRYRSSGRRHGCIS